MFDRITLGNIEFANGNSWRGDNYENVLRAAIVQYDIDFSAELDKKLHAENTEGGK